MQSVAPLNSVLVAFSPSLDYLAVATQDGRLRAFETSTGRLLFNISAAAPTEPAAGTPAALSASGPSEQTTCIAWAKAPPKAGKKGKRAADTELGRLHLVVGTAMGSLCAFSAASAKQAWAATGVNEGGVAAVAYAEEAGSGGLLYSVGADARVVALETGAGKQVLRFKAGKHPLRAAAASPDSQSVLVGSSSLALWSVVEQNRLAKFTGHTLPARCVAFAPDGEHALSAGEGERQIALWATPSAAQQQQQQQPPPGGARKAQQAQQAAGLLSLEEPAVSIATSPGGAAEDGASFQVVAVSTAGKAYVWRCSVEEQGRVSASLAAKVDVAGASPLQMAGEDDGILAVHFESPSSLLVARGPLAKPTFDRIQLPRGRGETALIHLQRAAPRGGEASTSGKAAAQQGQKGHVAYAGAEPTHAELLRPRVADGSAPVSRKRRAETEEAAVLDGREEDIGGEGTLANGPLAADGERTLGQRLEALQLQARAAEMDVDGGKGAPGGPLRADSVAVLLGQALQAQDRTLLEKCLHVGNERVIQASVRRLRPHHAAALLDAAVERLRTRANRGAALTAWIRAVLLHHTAYLMAAPGVLPILASLSQARCCCSGASWLLLLLTIDARTALLRPLAALAGRLDLLIAHLPKPGGAGGAPEQQTLPGPQVVYVEEDELGAEDPYAAGEDSGSDKGDGEGDNGEAAEDEDDIEDDLDDDDLEESD